MPKWFREKGLLLYESMNIEYFIIQWLKPVLRYYSNLNKKSSLGNENKRHHKWSRYSVVLGNI